MVKDVEEYAVPYLMQKRKFANFETEDFAYITALRKLREMNLSSEILKETKAFNTLQEIEKNGSLIDALKDPAKRLLAKWKQKLGVK